MTFLRGAAGQCAAYALVLGALFGLPGVAAFAVAALRVDLSALPGVVVMIGSFLAVIAVVGAVPAMVSAAIVWRIFLRRRDGSPPSDVVPYCWFATLAGSYLIIPFWGLLVASISTSPLGPLERLGAGFGVVVAGFVFTVPYVAPVTYLGTWLWVRRLRPRLMAGGARPGVMTIGT
jgi:hypothetical protein